MKTLKSSTPRIRRHGVEDTFHTASLKGTLGAAIEYTASAMFSTSEGLVSDLVRLYRAAKGDPREMDVVDRVAGAAMDSAGGWHKAVLIARARERYAALDPFRYWQITPPTPQEADEHARAFTFYAPEPDDPRDDVPPFGLWAHRDPSRDDNMPRVVSMRAVNGRLSAMDRTDDCIDMSRWKGEWCRLTPDLMPVPRPGQHD